MYICQAHSNSKIVTDTNSSSRVLRKKLAVIATRALQGRRFSRRRGDLGIREIASSACGKFAMTNKSKSKDHN
jgi:hypothetical protein